MCVCACPYAYKDIYIYIHNENNCVLLNSAFFTDLSGNLCKTLEFVSMFSYSASMRVVVLGYFDLH